MKKRDHKNINDRKGSGYNMTGAETRRALLAGEKG